MYTSEFYTQILFVKPRRDILIFKRIASRHINAIKLWSANKGLNWNEMLYTLYLVFSIPCSILFITLEHNKYVETHLHRVLYKMKRDGPKQHWLRVVGAPSPVVATFVPAICPAPSRSGPGRLLTVYHNCLVFTTFEIILFLFVFRLKTRE